MFGTISRHKNEVIRRGAKEVILDYLVDVVEDHWLACPSEVDFLELRRVAKEVVMPTMVSQMLHNLVHMIDGMLMSAQREVGANFTLWFPLYRQINAGMRLMRFQKSRPDHIRGNLDRVRERSGVRLGPLQHDPSRAKI